jgi:hypothetical protein
MKRSRYFLVIALLLVGTLTSCGSPATPPPTQIPFPTNTPAPTATPIPSTPTQPPQTEFLVNASEFPSCFDQEGGAEWKAFGNGVGENGKIYMMITTPPYGFQDPCTEQVFSNFTFEADATLIDPNRSVSNTYYGLVFRQDFDTNQDCQFLIGGDGGATLIVDDGPSRRENLVAYTQVPQINKIGEVNHLKVVAVGDTLRVFVNDALVGEVQDATIASGTIGFFLQSGDSKEQQVVFEHAKITKMP